MRNFNKLCQLFGKDRADGQHAKTAAEMRKMRSTANEESDIYTSLDNIEGVESIFGDNENLENIDASQQTSQRSTPQRILNQNLEDVVRSHSISHGEASSKKMGKKKVKVDEEVVLLK
ncbi:unnamed protein product [Cuscuta epithymum]|uniref:Uncharacterized protein n=1 Tax=Cuscuta epithymum TaxID=186058 RepID=A0AAV0C2E5_9ASTE|nr:unnamed protein product [Cuscuta epithymum]